MGAGPGKSVPFDPHGQRLVGALHQTDGLLSVAGQRDLVDVDQLVAHLETDGRRLAALLHLREPRHRGYNR